MWEKNNKCILLEKTKQVDTLLLLYFSNMYMYEGKWCLSNTRSIKWPFNNLEYCSNCSHESPVNNIRQQSIPLSLNLIDTISPVGISTRSPLVLIPWPKFLSKTIKAGSTFWWSRNKAQTSAYLVVLLPQRVSHFLILNALNETKMKKIWVKKCEQKAVPVKNKIKQQTFTFCKTSTHLYCKGATIINNGNPIFL